MTHPTHPSISPDHEFLVAYLDGELSPELSLQVERRLSQEQDFRKLLRELQSTWDLLDELPQPTLDDGFTRTTVEMVAVRLAEDVDRETSSMLKRRIQRRCLMVVGTMASLLVGFWATRQFQSRRDRELLQDLPVIERIDMYTQIDDVTFLRQLAEADLFEDATEEAADDSSP